MRPVRTAARGMLSAIFIVSGVRAVADPEKLVPAAKRVTDRVGPLLEKTDPRLPTDPRTLVRINGAVHLVGGLLLATGHFTRPAAAALAGSLVPTTFGGHPFWTFEDPAVRVNHQTHFLKNLGLLGGLLLAAADSEGRPSLRWRTNRLAKNTRRSMRRTARRGYRLSRHPGPVQWKVRVAGGAAHVRRRLPS
jgi:putative oxidoreductase